MYMLSNSILSAVFLSASEQTLSLSETLDSVIGILTVLISVVSVVSVIVMQMRQTRYEQQAKRNEKKNSWYRSEVLSRERLDQHIDNLRNILFDKTLTKQEICVGINEAMLDFFYQSVNYVAFFDLKHYNTLKQKVMSASDNIMHSVLVEDDISDKRADEIIEIYRMNLMYLFYEYEMKIN